VTLRVRHTTGEEVDLTMNRESILVPTVKGFKRTQSGDWDWYVSTEPKIGYIRLTQFTPDMVERVKEAIVGEGPTMKRMMARARGSGSRILKRSSHIRIVLTDEIKIETRETRKAAQKAAKKKASESKAGSGATEAKAEKSGKRAKKEKK